MTNDLDRDLRDTFHRHQQDMLGRGPTPSPRAFRRIRHRQAVTVLTAAVAVAAITIAGISGISAIRASNQTPAVPGGAGTGPTETGPTETGPTETGPLTGDTGDPFSVGFNGLPPEGVTPSEPPQGELVLSDWGIHPWYAVNLYADGRMIWARGLTTNPGPTVSVWIEQRLTPEGVELLRSVAVPLGGQFENPGQLLPVSAWEDPTLRPYVPSRYAACLLGGFEPPSLAMELLPAGAQDLLRGTERPVKGFPGCVEVTIEDARALAEILSDAGFEQTGGAIGPGGFVMFADPNGNREPNLGVPNFEGLPGIEFSPLLPDGTTYEVGG